MKDYKISIRDLQEIWKIQGIWGDWRNLLKKGYREDELYFEFGLTKHKDIDIRIIVNHSYYINFSSNQEIEFRDYMIFPNSFEKTTKSILNGIPIIKDYISQKEYSCMLKEAQKILNEYKNDEYGCFWSIPNKWFGDTFLIKFIEKKIMPIIPKRKDEWYFP